MTAAVSELESEYADQADFVVISPEETAKASADIERFGFTDNLHGLVIFDGAGEPAVKLPGHSYGREEIEAGLKEVLGS